MQPSAEALSKLLLTLYAAPTQPELWIRFLQEFTRHLGLPAAAILHQDLARENYQFNIAVGVDPAAQSSYERYYGQLDAWRPKFLAKREGELALGEELCATKELLKTEFYGDYLSKYGLGLYAAVATVKRPTSFELVSLYGGLPDSAPGPEILAAIELVVPHVRTALQLRHQLCEAQVSAKTPGHDNAMTQVRPVLIRVGCRQQNAIVRRAPVRPGGFKGKICEDRPNPWSI